MATAPNRAIATPTLSLLAFIAGVTTGVHAALAFITFSAGGSSSCIEALAFNDCMVSLTAAHELRHVIAFMVLVAIIAFVAHVSFIAHVAFMAVVASVTVIAFIVIRD